MNVLWRLIEPALIIFVTMLVAGNIIDIRQTVNGYSLFTIVEVEPLDIRYAYDINRKYEYDKEDLLRPCKTTGEVDWQIVGKLPNTDDKMAEIKGLIQGEVCIGTYGLVELELRELVRLAKKEK